MADGLKFATLATLIGKRNRAKFGNTRCTIAAMGRDGKGRWIMATMASGMVVFGEPSDFEIIPLRKRKAAQQ